MNFRQLIILVLTLAIIGAIFYFTPRYKIVTLPGEGNFMRTEQGSSLFERCKEPAKYNWPIITKRGVPVLLVGLLLIFILKDRRR